VLVVQRGRRAKACQSAFWNRHVDLLRYLGSGCEAMEAPSLRWQGLRFDLGPTEVSQHDGCCRPQAVGAPAGSGTQVNAAISLNQRLAARDGKGLGNANRCTQG
jgi:hypothetical protein